ncbi:MAG: hypothetical protein GY828_04535 [Candidatus Gracilibacteria bacterium]|nr:hypothetical protein [Candidatus Gracilibacteria bacterium]
MVRYAIFDTKDNSCFEINSLYVENLLFKEGGVKSEKLNKLLTDVVRKKYNLKEGQSLSEVVADTESIKAEECSFYFTTKEMIFHYNVYGNIYEFGVPFADLDDHTRIHTFFDRLSK